MELTNQIAIKFRLYSLNYELTDQIAMHKSSPDDRIATFFKHHWTVNGTYPAGNQRPQPILCTAQPTLRLVQEGRTQRSLAGTQQSLHPVDHGSADGLGDSAVLLCGKLPSVRPEAA